jgi:peptidoglycan/xylan/chitin deacetylase (PgdA/CDA1 family)/GT2 family glycosyltransferase
MDISVIIATFNRRALLERTLPPLLAQDFAPDRYEVIVVVDGSIDGTADFLRTIAHRGNLRIIEQPNRGQAAAINAGLQQSRGGLVLFLDDDILCGPTLVAEHALAPRSGKACMAFGPVLVASEATDTLAVDWARTFCDDFFQSKVHEAPEKGWHGCMASANSSLPRNIALSIGGLDDSFSRANDVEFGFRLLKAGYTFVYQPTAITHQIFQKTRHNVVEDASGEGRAEVRLSRKFPELRTTTRLALLSSRPWWKRALARTLATAPVSLVGFVEPFTFAFDKLRSLPGFRRGALRLLMTQQNIAAYRSAVREAGSWKALRREFGARLPILMYHSIGPLREGFDAFLTISPEMFERHLRWLTRHGYTPIHLAEWIGYCRDGRPIPEKPVVLTFDDGYRDTAEFGFPLLKKYGFKGTLFLVTDHIGGSNIWDLPLGVSEQPLMAAEEVRHWAANGIEIGSHSRSHPDLRSSTSEVIAMELKQSRACLERLLGTPVTTFAYPYGYLDHRAPEAARSVYDAALTCDLGINLLSTDPMLLRRATVVPRFTWGQMFWCTRFGYNLLLILRIQAGLQLKPVVKRLFPWVWRDEKAG